MSHTIDGKTFVPLRRISARLVVPESWLKSEIDAGRLPVLRAGRRRLVNLEIVEKALLARAYTKPTKGEGTR